MSVSMRDRVTSEAPLVSVIIPVYNISTYLPQCLNSLLQQTYRNLEIILIDDGSTDGCGNICDEYAAKDERVNVYHTENRGLSVARNKGLDHARGEYISFVDGDDWVELGAIEQMINIAVSDNADVVIAGWAEEYVRKSIPSFAIDGKVQILCGQAISHKYAQGILGDVVWNKIYHKRCFESIRFPDGHNYEDVAVTPKLFAVVEAQEGRVAVLPEMLFHFRIRRSSISHTRSLTNIIDYWTAQQSKYDQAKCSKEQFLSGCYMAIGRMWMSYVAFPEEERKKASDVIKMMQDFSRNHYHEMMKGNHSKSIKMICVTTQFKSIPIMWLSHYAGQFHHMMKNIRFKLYE